MRMGMERGTFMINESCVKFLDEARNYAIDDAGRFSDPDDHIDSARIGILALIQGFGETVVNASSVDTTPLSSVTLYVPNSADELIFKFCVFRGIRNILLG